MSGVERPVQERTKEDLTKYRPRVLLLLIVCGAVSALVGLPSGWKQSGGPTDFQAVDFGARCLLQGHNPYNPRDIEAIYLSASRESPSPSERQRKLISLYVNLPTSFLIFAPFALLPLRLAQVIWAILVAAGLVSSAYFIWKHCEHDAHSVSALLIGFLLINSPYVFSTGNTGGLVAGLIMVSVLCFLQGRLAALGTICLAISLAIKPHNGGLIWLYFLLSGGVYRKRALQTLVIVALFSAGSVLWLSEIAPTWWRDWQTNMATISEHGNFNDPGPAGVVANTFAKIISLSAVLSVFRDVPSFYTVTSYLICGSLLIAWLIVTYRTRPSIERAWLAVAAIVPLTLIITYHRVYDTKIVMLVIPACAMTLSERGFFKWIALALNVTAIMACSDIPLIMMEEFVQRLHLSLAHFSGQMWTVILDRTTPLAMLALCVFNLWLYIRRSWEMRSVTVT